MTVALKLVIFPGIHLAVLDHPFEVWVHLEMGMGRMRGAPVDCPVIETETSHTEVVLRLWAEKRHEGATLSPGTAAAEHTIPVPPGPVKEAEKTVLDEVEQEAFPDQLSVPVTQVAGAAGLTEGYPTEIPLVRLTTILHCDVEPSLAAVIEQLGFGIASTRGEEQVACPPGPSITALKSKLLLAEHPKLGLVRVNSELLFQSKPPL